MTNLLQVIALTVRTWAVYADAEGRPVFDELIALGIFEVEKPHSTAFQISAGIVAREHMLAADWLDGFVGYAYCDDHLAWAARCAAKRKAILDAAAEEEKKKKTGKQIIIPDGHMPKDFKFE